MGLSQRRTDYNIRMRKITKELESNENNTGIDDDIIEKEEIEMNERQLLLIKVITKLSALFGVFVSDGIIIVIFGIIAFSLQSITMYYIFWSLFSLGHMI